MAADHPRVCSRCSASELSVRSQRHAKPASSCAAAGDDLLRSCHKCIHMCNLVDKNNNTVCLPGLKVPVQELDHLKAECCYGSKACSQHAMNRVPSTHTQHTAPQQLEADLENEHFPSPERPVLVKHVCKLPLPQNSTLRGCFCGC